MARTLKAALGGGQPEIVYREQLSQLNGMGMIHEFMFLSFPLITKCIRGAFLFLRSTSIPPAPVLLRVHHVLTYFNLFVGFSDAPSNIAALVTSAPRTLVWMP
jgi:hypothetical protein